MTLPAPPAVDHPWLALRRDLPREHGFESLEVRGTLPPGLRGTLFRNGPGHHVLDDDDFQHVFDRDGAISAVRIDGAGAAGAARVIASAGRAEELAAGAVRYAGFKARPRGFWRQVLTGRVKNAANTHVIAHQGELLALYELAGPTRVDPVTLETLGPTDLGVLRGPLSAHPHRVASRGQTVGFGLRLGWRRSLLDVYLMPDQRPARHLVTLPVGRTAFLHDFVATARHAVFFVSPVALDPVALVRGASFGDALTWQPARGTEVIVVPLDAPERVRRFRVDPFYQWHFANAWDDGDRVVVDFVRYDDFTTSAWLERIFHGPTTVRAPGRLTRAVVDPARETLHTETLWGAPVEFPRVAPAVEGARHRAVFVAAHADVEATGHGLQDRIARVDTDTGAVDCWVAGPGRTVNEPVVAPDGDRAWVLCPVYDGARDRSFLAVLDAGALAAGPVAELWFDHRLPMTFHGSWLPG